MKLIPLALLAVSLVATLAPHPSKAEPVRLFMRGCEGEVSGLVYRGSYAFTPTGPIVTTLYFSSYCPYEVWVELQ